MDIQTSSNCPDDTYFRTGEVEPAINGDSLTIYTGQGTRRGWGAPGVTSTVVLNDPDLVSIHIGFHHKHGGGQFWRHLVAGAFVPWNKLTDGQQDRILAAVAEHKAPNWAKAPGIRRAEHKAPTLTTRGGYKIVGQRPDGTLYSLYDGATTYQIGKRLAQKAYEDHGGGFYAYGDQAAMLRAFQAGTLLPERCYAIPAADQFVVLAVQMAGTFVTYDGGKFAATYCTPVELLGPIQPGAGALAFAAWRAAA